MDYSYFSQETKNVVQQIAKEFGISAEDLVETAIYRISEQIRSDVEALWDAAELVFEADTYWACQAVVDELLDG